MEPRINGKHNDRSAIINVPNTEIIWKKIIFYYGYYIQGDKRQNFKESKNIF